jgi:U3 small nucleolar ribonucleoprotein component
VNVEDNNEKSQTSEVNQTTENDKTEESVSKNDIDKDDEFAFLSRHEKEQKMMKETIRHIEKENLLEDDKEEEEELSKYEREEMKLYKRIKQLEEENLAEKPWQLRGEIQVLKLISFFFFLFYFFVFSLFLSIFL